MGNGRLAIARAAYATWLATPERERPEFFSTLEKFAKFMKLTPQEIASFESEEGFEDSVMNDSTYLKRSVHPIIAALVQRAMTPNEDQLRYSVAVLRLAGHSGADKIADLIEE